MNPWDKKIKRVSYKIQVNLVFNLVFNSSALSANMPTVVALNADHLTVSSQEADSCLPGSRPPDEAK